MTEVVATQKGYYKLEIRYPGAKFKLSDRKHFSDKWMQPVGWDPRAKEKPVVAIPKRPEPVQDQPGTLETDADPQNPNVPAEPESDVEPVTALPIRGARRRALRAEQAE
jgi:hypothetical protein